MGLPTILTNSNQGTREQKRCGPLGPIHYGNPSRKAMENLKAESDFTRGWVYELSQCCLWISGDEDCSLHLGVRGADLYHVL